MFFKLLQLLKALLSITLRFLGNLILVKSKQPSKAPSPIISKPSGSLIFLSDE